MKETGIAVILGLASILLAGCSDPGPALGTVTGTITLEGEPVEGAFVYFMPLFEGGREAVCTQKTDASGSYEMMYSIDRKGVLVGKHQVQVTTEDWPKRPDGTNAHIPERIPRWYFGPDSVLEFDVKEGENVADFDLTKKKPK